MVLPVLNSMEKKEVTKWLKTQGVSLPSPVSMNII
jgi:hypothetical protein